MKELKKGEKLAYELLLAAAMTGRVALVRAQRRVDGKDVALLMLVEKVAGSSSAVDLIPLAEILDERAMDRYEVEGAKVVDLDNPIERADESTAEDAERLVQMALKAAADAKRDAQAAKRVRQAGSAKACPKCGGSKMVRLIPRDEFGVGVCPSLFHDYNAVPRSNEKGA